MMNKIYGIFFAGITHQISLLSRSIECVFLTLSILFALSLEASHVQDYNPNITTGKERKYIIKQFAGKALLRYAKKTKQQISITNNLYQSFRYTPYIELLYTLDNNQYNVYSSENPSQFNTLLGYQLDINVVDGDPIINDQRQFMMDLNMSVLPIKTMSYPLKQWHSFISNPSISVMFKLVAQVTTFSEEPYVEQFVNRWNTFVYYPSTLVYLLISPLNKIYVMQTVSENVANPSFQNLLYLNSNSSLQLPSGWIYTYLELDTDTFLTVPSNGEARVIRDSLSNSYMYVVPESNPWLYKMFRL